MKNCWLLFNSGLEFRCFCFTLLNLLVAVSVDVWIILKDQVLWIFFVSDVIVWQGQVYL